MHTSLSSRVCSIRQQYVLDATLLMYLLQILIHLDMSLPISLPVLCFVYTCWLVRMCVVYVCEQVQEEAHLTQLACMLNKAAALERLSRPVVCVLSVAVCVVSLCVLCWCVGVWCGDSFFTGLRALNSYCRHGMPRLYYLRVGFCASIVWMET